MAIDTEMPSVIAAGQLTTDRKVDLSHYSNADALIRQIDNICAGDGCVEPGGKISLSHARQYWELKALLGEEKEITAGGSTANSLHGLTLLHDNPDSPRSETAIRSTFITYSAAGPNSLESLRGLFDCDCELNVIRDHLNEQGQTPFIRVYPKAANLVEDRDEFIPQISYIIVFASGARCSISYPGTPHKAMRARKMWPEEGNSTLLTNEELQAMKDADWIATSMADLYKWKAEGKRINRRALEGPAAFAQTYGLNFACFLPKTSSCHESEDQELCQSIIREKSRIVLGNEEELLAVYANYTEHEFDNSIHKIKQKYKDGKGKTSALAEARETEILYRKVEKRFQDDLRFQQSEDRHRIARIDEQLQRLQGIPHSEEDIARLYKRRQCFSTPIVAFITRGIFGAILITPDDIIPMPVMLVEKAKNEIGAGDATAAGFLRGLIPALDDDPKTSLLKAALLGSKMGNLVVQQDPARIERGGTVHREAWEYCQQLQTMESDQLYAELDRLRNAHDQFLETTQAEMLKIFRDDYDSVWPRDKEQCESGEDAD